MDTARITRIAAMAVLAAAIGLATAAEASDFSWNITIGGGYYTYQTERVLVQAGYYKKVYVPARPIITYDEDGVVKIVIAKPHYTLVWIAPTYRTVRRRVYVPNRSYYSHGRGCGCGLCGSAARRSLRSHRESLGRQGGGTWRRITPRSRRGDSGHGGRSHRGRRR